MRRLRSVPSIQQIVLATTVNEADDPLVEFARRLGIDYYRGSENDVMARVIETAESVSADVIVEITGDCPVIDTQIVEQTIRMFQAHDVAYVSNSLIRSYPDGMDTQVFLLKTLIRSSEMTNDPLDREHVTLYIRNHPELFSHVHLLAPPELHWPELGLTLDELSDYELLKQIIEHFDECNPLFSCLEAVRFLRTRPDLVEINRKVVRKGDT